MVETIKEQTYPNWELCLSDGSGANSPIAGLLESLAASDERIKVVSHEESLQISENTNAAIEIATGDYIAFADHDDELTPNALFECVKALNKNRDVKVLYSDEDKMSMDGHKFFQPHFKPDYNPDLLCTVNYICHLFVVDRKVIEQVGTLRKEFDGAQDYDFIFRCIEAVSPEEICHVPKILYHWRCHEESTAENPESKTYAFESGKRAIEEHYRRTGIDAEVYQGEFLGLYRTRFHRDHDPLISIIIPNKDHIDDLKRCMDSIDQKSTYKNYEYIIVENNSTDDATFQYYKKLEAENPKAHVVYWDKEFNYSAINNYEFKYREADFGRFPKGLIYGLNFLNSWLYDDAKALELADSLTPLATLKEKVDTGYFEQLIKESFLDNTHKAYVYLYPEEGKNERLEEELKAQLAKMKNKLNSKQLNYLIEDTKKLKEFQETPSTQEELEKIPTLSLSDISREVRPFKN